MEITARDIMSTDLISTRDDATLDEGVKLLMNYRITGLPVVDKVGKLVGVLSEYDILNQIEKFGDESPKRFSEKIEYSKNIVGIDEKTSLKKVLQLLVNAKVRRVPVVNSKGRLVGIITRRDLIRLYYYRARFID